jgi:hypothetical protein
VAELLIAKLAPNYGVDPNATDYNLRYRNPVFSYLSAERIMMLYANAGLEQVSAELDNLARRGIIPRRIASSN